MGGGCLLGAPVRLRQSEGGPGESAHIQPGGFILYYKRLEQGRFRLPRVDEQARAVALDATQLAMLLDGIDVAQVKRPPTWQPSPSAQATRSVG